MAPTSVFLSSGSPVRSSSMRRRSRSSRSSATPSCTSSREPAQHTWPWLKKIPSTMPSTAWSSAASSKTRWAPLPPSSSVRRVPVPATARRMALPTSVEPVKATLSTPGWAARAAPVGPAPVTTLTTPGRQLGLGDQLGQQEGRERRGLGGLQHDRVAAGERRGDLPGGHQQREVPGDDLPHHAERAGASCRARRTPACPPTPRGGRGARRPAGRRRRATRGSACRRRSTRARRTRGSGPAAGARGGTGTCRALGPSRSRQRPRRPGARRPRRRPRPRGRPRRRPPGGRRWRARWSGSGARRGPRARRRRSRGRSAGRMLTMSRASRDGT